LTTYAVVAIVKDEAAGIDRFVASVGPLVSHAVIVDTGSTDGTLDAACQFACPVTVESRPWVDFGHNRSEAFALARGTADWLLALDADMTVEIDPDFEPDPAVDAYMVRMGSDDFAYRLPLLLRGDLPWESRGAVHEYTCLPDRPYVGVPTDKVRVTTHGDRSSREKSLWHAGMLEAEVARDPDNARSVFYLANTYFDLGDPRALAMYERRVRMGGWDQEVFYSRYRYALLLPTWPAQLQALVKAWEARPTRLEPVYEIAKAMNARGEHHAAYRFATVAVEPSADDLFIHQSVWNWGMDFERSIAAWWVGRRDECRDLCDALLERKIPDHIRAQVEANRAFC
jgi:glycosyltransferase involved in cell wall biosynthesis